MVDQHADLKPCDLVMKGGITSGVIYPRAVSTLSTKYRFRSIGGASAGAIAAAAAAAAEYARQESSDKRSRAGFTLLEKLPEEIGAVNNGKTKLLSLFEPARTTSRLFRLVLAFIAKHGKWWRIPVAVIGLAPWTWGFGWLVGFMCFYRGWPARGLLALVVTTLAGLGLGVWCAYRGVSKNRGGIADGLALSTWLADLIDKTAGRDITGPPLTFADLKRHDIDLAMITTGMSHGRPFRLPLADGLWFAKLSDLQALLPERVWKSLVAAGEEDLEEWRVLEPHILGHRITMNAIAKANPGYVPLPDGERWPVVIGARMSLSFPGLLSAVPLYTVEPAKLRANNHVLRVCWFSDGGICSNLPIHYFDSLLPERPTFALDLYEDPDGAVFLPASNDDNANDRWSAIGSPDRLSPIALAKGVLGTMQNWSDTMQTVAPGYRDRIVRIPHTKEEGGMNLDMGATLIEKLAGKGTEAATQLIAQFATSPRGWENHVWVRYRSALAMVQELLAPAIRAYVSDASRRAELAALIANPPSYRYTDLYPAAQQAAASDFHAQLANLAGALCMTAELREKAPRPPAELRARPKGS